MANKLIDRIRALIIQGWTKETLARDGKGSVVTFSDPNATCWCLQGALHRAVKDTKAPHELMVKVMKALAVGAGTRSFEDIPSFNDACDTDKDDILQAIDVAERRLNAEEEPITQEA